MINFKIFIIYVTLFYSFIIYDIKIIKKSSRNVSFWYIRLFITYCSYNNVKTQMIKIIIIYY